MIARSQSSFASLLFDGCLATSLGLGLYLLTALTPADSLVKAEAPEASPIYCATDGRFKGLTPKALCERVGKALGRTTRWVPDARSEKRGLSLQILHDDVQWTLVLLRKGQVRSWTRVSVADARGNEAAFFARALRSLLRAAPKEADPCVRLEPKQRSKRAPDLVYPWAELKPCVRQVVDVVDPWWSTPNAP